MTSKVLHSEREFAITDCLVASATVAVVVYVSIIEQSFGFITCPFVETTSFRIDENG